MKQNSTLSFNDLRMANIIRLPQYKNAQGEPAHTEPDGSDWSPSDWMLAVVGELGEAANIMKKIRCGDIGPVDSTEYRAAIVKLAKEFADVITYLDIAAYQYRLDLGACVEIKFNEVSRRVGADVFFHEGQLCREIKDGDLKTASLESSGLLTSFTKK